jgi:1,4-dihydroxy-2-naphthoate octaprenyltransferase
MLAANPPSALKLWFMAARPRTLPAALAPILIGTALAFGSGKMNPWAALACLVGALLLQIGTNLANDYFDFVKGADTADRIGPTRVTQAGLIAPKVVRNAFLLTFALVALPGAYLMYLGGWPVLVVGILSVLSGIAYTGGPFPLGYNGLGDLFVFIFFGLVAVSGTFYVQTGLLPPEVILAAVGPGLLSTAILVVNNLRDMKTDAVTGKRTLAVRFGAGFVRTEYLLCILGAALIPLLLLVVSPTPHPGALAALLFLIPAVGPVRKVMAMEADPRLNPVLGETGKLLLIYSLLFSLGWVLL